MLALLAVGVALSMVVAYLAAVRGRSGNAWFILSLVVTPVVSGIVLALVGRERK